MLAEVIGVQHAGLWPFSPCSVFADCCGAIFARLFGPCFPLVRVVASRGAPSALTEVFPESELQAGNSAFMR